MTTNMKTAYTARSENNADLARATRGKGGVVTGPIDISAAREAASNILSIGRLQNVDADTYRKIAESPGFPQAPGWRLIIIPVKPPTKTAGGIELPDEVIWANEVLCDMGYVASMGPVAFKDPRFLKSDAWCKVGDFVNYGRLNGKDIIFRGPDGKEHRLHVCNDRDVLMRITDPNAMKVYS